MAKKNDTAEAKGTAGEKTLVTLLLDRSGSMGAMREETITGVNDWLANLRTSEADIRLSLVLFDHAEGKMQLEKLYVARPISKVADMAWGDFVPRGNTPLIDAAWETITAVRDSLKGKKAKAVIAIQTDGFENMSKKHGWESLRALIAECEAEGYQFQFIGAGIDAYDQGAKMGLDRSKIMSYGTDREATRAAFSASAMNTSAYADGRSMSMEYSREQKLASRDVYDDEDAAERLKARKPVAKAAPARAMGLRPNSLEALVGRMTGGQQTLYRGYAATSPAPDAVEPLDLAWEAEDNERT